MTYMILLSLHIFTAIVTGFVILYALTALARRMAAHYKTIALMLGFVAALEVLTGTMIAILSPELSAASLALHIALYMSVCLGVESLLYVRMHKLSLIFPLRLATVPALLSVMMFVAAVSYGF